jgi:NADH-quinone oxidoreductase subunit M
MQGAILQMVNHGVITGALFLCVGVIYDRTHDRTIAKMGGLAAVTPVYVTIFGFFMLASLGLPGLSGFIGEFLVFLGTFIYQPAAAFFALLVIILGAAYLMWMFQRVAFGELSEFLTGLGHHLTDINRTEVATLAPLVALTLLFGLFPGLVLNLVSHPVDTVLQHIAQAAPVALGK